MNKRLCLYIASLLLVSSALLQSCASRPKQQPPAPPVDRDASDITKDPDGLDGSSAAKLGRPEAEAVKQPGELFKEAPPAELLPESVISLPAMDAVTPGLKYNTIIAQRMAGAPGSAGWQYRKNLLGEIVGFEFSNRGGNRILPERYDIGKNKHFTRDFQFRFDDRARQDIHFSVTDWVPSRDKQFRLSELMNSVLLFFPRTFVPAIATTGANTVVTLPTGEKVEFDAKTHEIVSGVLVERPVALSAPQFPAVDYVGKGVAVRANSRGKDPRVGTVATITTGSPDPNCSEGQRCNECQVPAKELWEQNGAVRFKFSTDEEFDRYLRARCGFGLFETAAKFISPVSTGKSNE
jgi:hypothetical protein